MLGAGLTLSILSRLCAAHPSVTAWKHLDQGLAGVGDIDLAAPHAELNAITADLLSQIGSLVQDAHVLCCDHVPGIRALFIVTLASFPRMAEIDLFWRPTRLGATWAPPARLAELSSVRDDGVRQLASGTEAFVDLVYRHVSLRPTVPAPDEWALLVDRARSDEEMFLRGPGLLPRPARSVGALAATYILRGRWTTGGTRALAMALVGAAAATPAHAAARAAYRTSRPCTARTFAMRGRVSDSASLSEMLATFASDHGSRGPQWT